MNFPLDYKFEIKSTFSDITKKLDPIRIAPGINGKTGKPLMKQPMHNHTVVMADGACGKRSTERTDADTQKLARNRGELVWEKE